MTAVDAVVLTAGIFGSFALLFAFLAALADWIERPRPDSANRRDARRRGRAR